MLGQPALFPCAPTEQMPHGGSCAGAPVLLALPCELPLQETDLQNLPRWQRPSEEGLLPLLSFTAQVYLRW